MILVHVMAEWCEMQGNFSLGVEFDPLMKFRGVLLLILSISVLSAEPLISSWFTESSGKYARLFETLADESAGNAVTTWDRGQGAQAQPTYVGIHEISKTATDVYVRTSGLGSHVMGPWYLNAGKTNLFPNYPGNQAVIYRLPLDPGTPPVTKTLTGLGRIGLFVDGVSMFDSRDAFSFDTSAGLDDSPNGGAVTGDGVWNRDAFVNESVTFDAANAHQAGANYHYHANPPALRHQLGDSVDYDAVTNRYTENFNGGHSPILGWVRDGYPVYGPYGYSDANDATSEVTLMRSGFRRRGITVRETLPAYAARDQGFMAAGSSSEYALAANQYGPPVSDGHILGHYLEDYEYRGDFSEVQGVDFDLNEHNGRFCVTPEYPSGTFAYFVSIEADGTPLFPYNIGRKYYGNPVGNNVATLPAGAEIIFEGGPEKAAEVPAFSENSGEVTVTWSAIEGGTYVVQGSDDLNDWAAVSATLTEDQLVVEESVVTRRFYRNQLLQVADFDDTGFSVQDQPSVGGNNILLIIVDDWGIDSSPIDNLLTTNHASMPNLAALASQGLRFTNAYAQPTCSPTRAGILTGRYSFRHGIGSPGGANLPESEQTLPEVFTAAGSPYGLGSFGKWHLGGGITGPLDLGGWPEFRGSLNAGVPDFYDWDKTINGVTTPVMDTYATTDQVDDAVSFINAQGEKPWLCWLAFNAPHTPNHEPPVALLPSNPSGTNARSLFEKSLEAMDTEIGRLMASVDLTTTNVFLIGDNGTGGNVVQVPYDSGTAKGTIYEGGIHVPFIALGPDVHVSGTSDALVQVTDLYATILELAGVERPEGVEIDGRSLFPILSGSGSVDGGVVLEAFGNGVSNPGRAIRIGDYKLHIYDSGNEEFYDVATDQSEDAELLALGLDATEQAAYDVIKARHAELDGGAVSVETGILSVSPVSAAASSTVTITFNLDPNGGTNVPPLNNMAGNPITPTVTLGSVTGTAVSRPSRYVVEATFVLPAATGDYNVEAVFPGPNIPTFGLAPGFEVTL